MRTSRAFNYRFLAVALLVAVIWVSIASYIVPLAPESGSFRMKGEYRLTSVRNGQENLYEGPVYFEFAERHSGIQNDPVFKLHFLSDGQNAGRGFGFVIPLQGNSRKIDRENYKVTSQKNYLADKFESVFGYADLVDGKGPLYFTESGSISISHASEHEVAGEMDLLLRDTNGNSMLLKGRFDALPLYGDLEP